MPEQVNGKKSTPRTDRIQSKVNSKITFNVSEKGAISVNGLRRFPTTLYFSEWEAIFTGCPTEGTLWGEIYQFATEHENLISMEPAYNSNGVTEKTATYTISSSELKALVAEAELVKTTDPAKYADLMTINKLASLNNFKVSFEDLAIAKKCWSYQTGKVQRPTGA